MTNILTFHMILTLLFISFHVNELSTPPVVHGRASWELIQLQYGIYYNLSQLYWRTVCILVLVLTARCTTAVYLVGMPHLKCSRGSSESSCSMRTFRSVQGTFGNVEGTFGSVHEASFSVQGTFPWAFRLHDWRASSHELYSREHLAAFREHLAAFKEHLEALREHSAALREHSAALREHSHELYSTIYAREAASSRNTKATCCAYGLLLMEKLNVP